MKELSERWLKVTQRLNAVGNLTNEYPILAWRADCEQRKQETIDAVKATANEQVPYNVQGVRIITASSLCDRILISTVISTLTSSVVP